MPTPATAKWPVPRSEDEWEDMVVDALRLRWQDPDARRNGRRGQRQNGVDIYGCATSVGGLAGAQCKNTFEPNLGQVTEEVAKAEGFVPKLAKFYFVAAAPRDAELEEAVRLLSLVRTSNGMFGVDVLFFDDICADLASRPELVEKHWPGWGSLVGALEIVEVTVSDEIFARSLPDTWHTLARSCGYRTRSLRSQRSTPTGLHAKRRYRAARCDLGRRALRT